MSDATLDQVNLGFLTILAEGGGFVGGYLVTSGWGRPLEFRLSTAVQPNRVQQILYGPTLKEHVCGDLIGRTLIEKTSTPIQLLFTDTLAVMPMRRRFETPIVALIGRDHPDGPANDPTMCEMTDPHSSLPMWFQPTFGDRPKIEAVLQATDAGMDLSEPFARIREAMGEARKMGVTHRAA